MVLAHTAILSGARQCEPTPSTAASEHKSILAISVIPERLTYGAESVDSK